MKKFLLFCVAAAGLNLTAQATVIYGYQTWEPGSELPFRGPVKFDATTPDKFTKLADCSNEGVVRSGYYYNYHWYGQLIQKGTESVVDGLYEIDMTTGEKTLIVKGGTKMVDMTYHYPSGKVYGVQNGNQWFAEFDPATGTRTLIGRFAENGTEVYILALAADYDGTVYAISSTDKLYKVDTSNGALTKVGDLGVDAAFDQTMAFDPATGVLYWANNGDYSMYTVDTTTGAATLVGTLGENHMSSMASLLVPFIDAPAGSPDRVVNPTATVKGTTVTLSWTNPTENVRGGTLSDLNGVKVYRDGTLVTTLTTTEAGKVCETTDTNLAEGDYTYTFVPYNSAGDGGVDRGIKVHVGTDRPGAVNHLTTTPGDGCVTLSWSAPTEGASGGAFTSDDVTSYLVKLNGSKIATLPAETTSYTDTRSFGKYSYTVSAVSSEGEGVATTIENVLVKPGNWIIMTAGEQALEAGKEYKFYDEGGPSANYYNTRNEVLTLKPSVPNAYVTVNFETFRLESYGDYMEVYQGAAAVAEALVGKYTGAVVPSELKHIESTAPDGALTFRFYSDIMEVDAGWAATATAVQRKNYDIEATALNVSKIAVVGEEYKAIVTVTNKGVYAAKNYTVELLDGTNVLTSAQGSELASAVATDIELAYTPTNEGTATLSARVVMDSDEVSDNNTTAPVTQTILAKGTQVVEYNTATPTDLLVVPASFLSVETLGQSVYEAELFGISANDNLDIVSLAFPYQEITTGYDNVPYVLWVGETDKTNLKDSSIPASALTKVFEGTMDMNLGDSHLEFIFDKPYQYQGGNFVYMLYKKPGQTNNNGVKFRGCYGYEGKHADVTRFSSNWYEDAEPLNPEENIGYSSNNMRPDLRLIFSPREMGVESAAVDTTAAAVEYYDLQGRKVAQPATGIYVRRQGSKIEKVFIH